MKLYSLYWKKTHRQFKGEQSHNSTNQANLNNDTEAISIRMEKNTFALVKSYYTQQMLNLYVIIILMAF